MLARQEMELSEEVLISAWKHGACWCKLSGVGWLEAGCVGRNGGVRRSFSRASICEAKSGAGLAL